MKWEFWRRDTLVSRIPALTLWLGTVFRLHSMCKQAVHDTSFRCAVLCMLLQDVPRGITWEESAVQAEVQRCLA